MLDRSTLPTDQSEGGQFLISLYYSPRRQPLPHRRISDLKFFDRGMDRGQARAWNARCPVAISRMPRAAPEMAARHLGPESTFRKRPFTF
jgi:hypothetical protein